jgi:hypothetical protein
LQGSCRRRANLPASNGSVNARWDEFLVPLYLFKLFNLMSRECERLAPKSK